MNYWQGCVCSTMWTVLDLLWTIGYGFSLIFFILLLEIIQEVKNMQGKTLINDGRSDYNQSCGSALDAVRIWIRIQIQHFSRSTRIRIRIHGFYGHKLYNFTLFLWVIFDPLDPDPADHTINTGRDTDPQHGLQLYARWPLRRWQLDSWQPERRQRDCGQRYDS